MVSIPKIKPVISIKKDNSSVTSMNECVSFLLYFLDFAWHSQIQFLRALVITVFVISAKHKKVFSLIFLGLV